MQKWLIVGLGNPGLGYKSTRHNVGWWALDRFAKKYGARLKKTSCGAKIVKIDYREDGLLILAKPLSFMNLSGKPVRCLIDANEINPANLVVLHDDIDLPVGSLRVRKKGSSGGQKGIESIIKETGNESFYRIKIGIGRPENSFDVIDYVLRPPTVSEKKALLDVCDIASDAIASLINHGFEETAQKYNCINPSNNSMYRKD